LKRIVSATNGNGGDNEYSNHTGSEIQQRFEDTAAWALLLGLSPVLAFHALS
jgi:hypothetical protein